MFGGPRSVVAAFRFGQTQKQTWADVTEQVPFTIADGREGPRPSKWIQQHWTGQQEALLGKPAVAPSVSFLMLPKKPTNIAGKFAKDSIFITTRRWFKGPWSRYHKLN